MAKDQNKSVFQLKNGNWGFRFCVRVNGKNVYKRMSKDENGQPFTTERQAVKARNAAIFAEQTPEARRVARHEVVRKTMGEVFAEFCEKGRMDRAYQTIRKQDSLWTNHLAKKFGKRFVDEISSQEIQDYLLHLYYGEGYSYQYVESFLKMFYLIFGQANGRGYLDTERYNMLCRNKLTKIKMPKMKLDEDTDIHIFEQEELEMLDEYFIGTNLELAYLLGRYCGLRINECFGLKWDCVDLEAGTINIKAQMMYQEGVIKLVQLKTQNAIRTIYLNDKLISFLKERRRQMDEQEETLKWQRLRHQRVIQDCDGSALSSMELVNTLPDGKMQTNNSMKYHSRQINQISIDDGLGYAVYTEYDQSDDNTNTPINHATTRSRMQRAVKNMLLDHMMDANSTVWEKSSTGTFTRDQANTQWGPVSYKILVPTGSEAYIRQAATLIPGKPYTLSGYMRSGAPKAFVRVAYTINGDTKYFNSDVVPVSENASDAPFQRVSVSFTLPETADAVVYCEAIGTTSYGYFWIDCMQLEEGLTCNHFNMLQNSDFIHETSGSTVPTGWAIGDGDSSYISIQDLSVADDIDGKMAPEFLRTSKAARVEGRYNRNITLNQDFRCYGNAGDRFTAGGWCKSFAKKMDEEGYVFCSLSVYFTANTTNWYLGGRVNFNYGEDGWQFASGSIVAPYNYTKVRFSLYMNRQMNHADFTGLYLYPESFGTDYVYDAKGNRKKAIQLYGGVKKTEYDDHDNMIQHTAPGHTKSSTFSYGDTEEQQKKHLMLESHSPLGTDGFFTYDDFGNATCSDTSGTVGNVTAITRSTTEFQHNGNYVHKQTDARGKMVTTEVDAYKGVTTSVADPKGQAVEYEHDTLRRVVKVKTTDGSREFRNEYTYDQTRGMLTGVKHNTDANTSNDVCYTFEYDELGRKTAVKIGKLPTDDEPEDTRVTLATNVYQNDAEQEHYGTLSQMQYGNGTVVKNEYDEFNRVTGVIYGTKSENAETATFENNPRYEYAYNANGQVAHVRNNLIGQIAESEYDLSNRPCRIKTHKFAEDTAGNVTSEEHVYTGEVAYDDIFGRLSKFTEQVGADHEAFVTAFGYDDENRPTSLEYGDYGESTLEYDGLGRVAKATVKAGDGTANTTTYTYVAGAALEDVTDKSSTTGLVESISQAGGNFTYTYDDNGNIVSVVQDGVTTSYTYDALGQLIRVVDGQEGATWEYSYDQGGNILSKKKYANGVETESMDFEYTNANWRDQLTKVNGTTITYDKIGNPLNDGTWQYTWQNGRQLKSMSKSGTFAKFVYNENGLRVQKIIQPSETDTTNAVVTKYTLHGKNIVHMTQGSNELHFFYDAQNKPAVVVFNGTPYSYVKNLQGDIVAILDSNGIAVVQYKYDAWGRQISCDVAAGNSNAAALSTLNPFRYRGYVYDEETGLYYLRSRYYAAYVNRFISPDTIIQGNLYCYGDNAVIRCIDSEGQKASLADKVTTYLVEVIVPIAYIDHSEEISIENCSPTETAAIQFAGLNPGKNFSYVGLQATRTPESSFSSYSGTHSTFASVAYDVADVISFFSGEIGTMIDTVCMAYMLPPAGDYFNFCVTWLSHFYLPETAPVTDDYTVYTLTHVYRNTVTGCRYAEITHTFYKCDHPNCSEHPSGTIDVTLTLCEGFAPGYGDRTEKYTMTITPR